MRSTVFLITAVLTCAGCQRGAIETTSPAPSPVRPVRTEIVYRNVRISLGMTREEVLAVVATDENPTAVKPYYPREPETFTSTASPWQLRFGTAWHDGGGGMELYFEDGKVSRIDASRYR